MEKRLKIICKCFFVLLISVTLVLPGVAQSGIFNARDFGAKGDGFTLDTKAIQSAIDQCHKQGGGTVKLTPGKYLSGSLVLKDHVVLWLDAGAILMGSLNMEDYPSDLGRIEMIEGVFFAGPLVYAENAQYVGIEGKGIIDGRGTRDNFEPLPPENLRPGLVRFRNCRFVTVKDVSLINSARWTLHLRECEEVTVSNIYLNSNVNRNNDGIDVDACQRVKILGCHINSEDDAIVLKSYAPAKVRDIVVADCILSSGCSAFKIGTETVGSFENITMSNCVVYGSRGINLFSVDGADINNVMISNVTMRDCKSAIQLRLGGRMRPYNILPDAQPKLPGRIRNVTMSNIQAVNVLESQDFISGIPGHQIENVLLSDIYINYKGGGSMEQASREVPEEITKYPKIGMFGDLPSYGFFVRHVNGIELRNIRLDYSNSDLRPAVVCQEVNRLKIAESVFAADVNGHSVVRLVNVSGAILKENQVSSPANVFFDLRGHCQNVIMKDNYLKSVGKLYNGDAKVLPGQVFEVGTIR